MTLEAPANGSLLSDDQTAVLQDPEFQEQTWQRRAQQAEADAGRYRAQLETLYGPESVNDWATEGLALPMARVDSPAAIAWEARVSGVSIKRNKAQGPQLVVTMTATLAGAPVRELAALTDDDLCFIRMAPLIQQLEFASMEAERMARQTPTDDDDITPAADDWEREELPDFGPEPEPERPKA